MLLDEVTAHLDEQRRNALFDHLMTIGAQVWMTGTDDSLFGSLKKQAQVIEISRDGLRENDK